MVFKRWKKDAGPGDDNPLARRVVRGDDSPTDPVEDPEHESTRRMPVSAEAETRIVGTTDAAPAPPAGVLVVIRGPGLGTVLPFGHGMNSVGRGPDVRVRLAFGDKAIARGTHARITYDAKGRRYFLQHGGGSELTYVNADPVLEPVQLSSGDRIVLGDTELLFRPLLGDDFHWEE